MDGNKAVLTIGAIPMTASPGTATPHVLSAALQRTARECKRPTSTIAHRHTMVHEQMSRHLKGFSRDAHPMAVMVGSVGALCHVLPQNFRSTLFRTASAHGRVIAHDHQVPTLAAMAFEYFRSASRSDSPEKRPRLCVELPAHVLCGGSREVRRRIRCWRARWITSSSCTPITSKTPPRRRCDPGWQLGRQNPFACIAAGCACLWGPARRGGARQCLGGIGRPERHSRLCQTREGQERQLPPDGLRPPRLQTLRSRAPGAHAEDLSQGPDRARHHQGRSAARRSPWSSRRSLSTTNLHRRKTYRKHRFLFRRGPPRRWAFRPRMSRCCLR